ncbi:MAG TPA: STAS domain-containing protein [Vicinamibacterales bacterium]|jgi:anti-anti-sigma factor
MEIREAHEGDVLVLAPEGSLTSPEDCSPLEKRMGVAVKQGTRYVVLDCGNVSQMTANAIRTLLPASRKLGRLKGRIVLCGMSAKLQKAFAISGFDRDFTVVPTRQEAVARALEPVAAAPSKRPASVPVSAGPAAPEPPLPPPPSPPPPAPEVAPQAPDPRLDIADALLQALGVEGRLRAAPPVPGAATLADADAVAAVVLGALAARSS